MTGSTTTAAGTSSSPSKSSSGAAAGGGAGAGAGAVAAVGGTGRSSSSSSPLSVRTHPITRSSTAMSSGTTAGGGSSSTGRNTRQQQYQSKKQRTTTASPINTSDEHGDGDGRPGTSKVAAGQPSSSSSGVARGKEPEEESTTRTPPTVTDTTSTTTAARFRGSDDSSSPTPTPTSQSHHHPSYRNHPGTTPTTSGRKRTASANPIDINTRVLDTDPTDLDRLSLNTPTTANSSNDPSPTSFRGSGTGGGLGGGPELICLCTPAPKVPRPRNAFILYRQHHQQQTVAANPGTANPEISKIIGKQWKHEPEERKAQWKRLAEEEKLRHQQQYPDYKYQPKRSNKSGKGGESSGVSTTPVSATFPPGVGGVVPKSEGGSASGGDPAICPKCHGRYIATPRTPSTPFAGAPSAARLAAGWDRRGRDRDRDSSSRDLLSTAMPPSTPMGGGGGGGGGATSAPWDHGPGPARLSRRSIVVGDGQPGDPAYYRRHSAYAPGPGGGGVSSPYLHQFPPLPPPPLHLGYPPYERDRERERERMAGIRSWPHGGPSSPSGGRPMGYNRDPSPTPYPPPPPRDSRLYDIREVDYDNGGSPSEGKRRRYNDAGDSYAPRRGGERDPGLPSPPFAAGYGPHHHHPHHSYHPSPPPPPPPLIQPPHPRIAHPRGHRQLSISAGPGPATSLAPSSLAPGPATMPPHRPAHGPPSAPMMAPPPLPRGGEARQLLSISSSGPPPFPNHLSRPSSHVNGNGNGGNGRTPTSSSSELFDQSLRLPPLQTHLPIRRERGEGGTSGPSSAARLSGGGRSPSTSPMEISGPVPAGQRGGPMDMVGGLNISYGGGSSGAGFVNKAREGRPHGQPPQPVITIRDPTPTSARNAAVSLQGGGGVEVSSSAQKAQEAMILSIPYLNKLEVFHRMISPLPPAAAARQGVSEVRGPIIAVEGTNPKLMALVAQAVERAVGGLGVCGVRCWTDGVGDGDDDGKQKSVEGHGGGGGGEEGKKREEEAGGKGKEREEKWERRGEGEDVAMADAASGSRSGSAGGDGTPPTAASSSGKTPTPVPAPAVPKSSGGSSSGAGSRAESIASFHSISAAATTTTTGPDGSLPTTATTTITGNPLTAYWEEMTKWHVWSVEMVRFVTGQTEQGKGKGKGKDRMPSIFGVSTSSRSSAASGSAVPSQEGGGSSSSSLQPQHQTPLLLPVALLPAGYCLTVSDRFACTVPITDGYAPVDHWQWMATMWRGVVLPDLVIYVQDQHRAVEDELYELEADGGGGGGGGGFQEQSVEFRRIPGFKSSLMVVRLGGSGEGEGDGGLLLEKTERRLGFEVVEWVRSGQFARGGGGMENS